MFDFSGIVLGNNSCKVQQIVNHAGRPVSKTSDIDFWVGFRINKGMLYIPVTKIDRQVNKFIVTSQILNTYYEPGRMILIKTDNGTITIPHGGITET